MKTTKDRILSRRSLAAATGLLIGSMGIAANVSNRTGQSAQGPYFGQKPPGMAPEIFAPGIVSTDAHEFSSSFTPDGKEFYFTRRETGQLPTLIMVSKCVDGIWTKPESAPFNHPPQQGQMSFEAMVTPDGKRLYFSSDRPLSPQANPGGMPMLNIWFVEREGDRWSTPEAPGPPFNPMKTMFISMTNAGTIYTGDISRGMAKDQIAVIRRVDGVYQSPEILGSPINDGSINNYPYISPDESSLIFTRRAAPAAFSQLLVTFKGADEKWGEPKALDFGQLSAGQGVLSPDGKYLFFNAGERSKGDIYWVDARIIDKLKPGQFVPDQAER
jgi:hypothetical protein